MSHSYWINKARNVEANMNCKLPYGAKPILFALETQKSER